MLKRAKVPDLNFCGCRIYLETHRNEITDADIEYYAKTFADVSTELERNRFAQTRRFYQRRAREVLGVV